MGWFDKGVTNNVLAWRWAGGTQEWAIRQDQARRHLGSSPLFSGSNLLRNPNPTERFPDRRQSRVGQPNHSSRRCIHGWGSDAGNSVSFLLIRQVIVDSELAEVDLSWRS